MTPDDRRKRMENKSRFWDQRIREIEDLPDDKQGTALAQAGFDRARAAARLSERDGDERVWHDLATVLTTWAQQHERRYAS